MNSRRYIAVLVFGLALVVLGGVSFMNSESGYKDFIKALNKSIMNEQTNIQHEFSVRENNITNMSGITKMNSTTDEGYMYNSIKIQGKEYSSESYYGKDYRTVFRIGEQYYESDSNKINSTYIKYADVLSKRLTKTIMSMVVGDAKKYFYREGNTIKVNLEKSQVPGIGKVIFGLAAHTNFMNSNGALSASTNKDIYFYDAYRNIDVERIYGEFVLEDGNIVLYKVNVFVTADNPMGMKSTLQLDNIIHVNYDKIKIKTIDTEGKEVLPLESLNGTTVEPAVN